MIYYLLFTRWVLYVMSYGVIEYNQQQQIVMEMFEQMNRKLDEGWKLTDSSCEECKSVVMFNPHQSTLVCLSGKHQNSEKPFEQPKSQSSENQFVELSSEVFKRSKTDDVSKKLGEKLIQGWAMLEDACYNCNVPIMKSKKGEMICFGCNQSYRKQTEVETQPKQKKVEESAAPIPQPQTPITQQKQQSKPSPKPQVATTISPKDTEANQRIIDTLYECFEKRFRSDFEEQHLTQAKQTFDLFQRFLEMKDKLRSGK